VGLRAGLEILKYTKYSSLSELEPRVLGCSPRSLMVIVTTLPGLSDDIQNYGMCNDACTSCAVSCGLLWPIGRFWTSSRYCSGVLLGGKKIKETRRVIKPSTYRLHVQYVNHDITLINFL